MIDVVFLIDLGCLFFKSILVCF